jgi:outer membrane protein assembly factor BamB
MSSLSVTVSAGGRVFSILDEGPLASVYLPSKWYLSARDAFNGVELWKRPITQWQGQLFPLKSGPFQLTRRLVATKDHVFATLGLYQPLSQIDAANGNIIRTYAGTEHTEEILYSNDKLILLVNDNKQPNPYENKKTQVTFAQYSISVTAQRSIVVIDPQSGRTLWKKQCGEVTPMTIAAAPGRIFYHLENNVHCLDINSGDLVWETEVETEIKLATNTSPGLVAYKDVLCLADDKKLTVLSVNDGKVLWSKQQHVSDYKSPTGVCVIDDCVWLPDSLDWDNNYWQKKRAEPTGKLIGYDINSGGKKRELSIDYTQGIGVCHHRCSMPKAADKYLLTSWPGVEFIDTTTGQMYTHNWVRGACLYGYMPANGMIYALPNPCACYPDGKLYGFLALAPSASRSAPASNKNLLIKGPAYGKREKRKSKIDITNQWPTLRQNAERSGSTTVNIPADIKRSWHVDVGGKLTQPVIADGKVFLASVDAHTVHALDAATGEKLWTYTAGGRIDSPPTYYNSNIIFGSRDGYVYSLTAEAGELVWKFRAAKSDRRIVSFDQLESIWPVQGSVLINNDKLYFAAGRSSFLDDGIFLYCLDPVTGEKINETQVYMLDKDGTQPRLRGEKNTGLAMDGALPDVLSSDGKNIYMRHMAFDLNANILDHNGGDHIYAMTGFLDGSWFHRSYWSYGSGTFRARSGIGGSGGPGSHIMVMDKQQLFSFGRATAPNHVHNFGEQHFLSSAPRNKTSDARRKSNDPKQWSFSFPMHVRAMLLAGQKLFAAGAKGDWTRSQDAFEGRQGIALIAVSAENGKTIAEYELPALPVFDGMAAANGRLYLSDINGNLTCFSER